MIAVLVPDEADEPVAHSLRTLAELFGDQAYVSLCLGGRSNDRLRLHGIGTMAPGSRSGRLSPTMCSSMSPAGGSYRMS